MLRTENRHRNNPLYAGRGKSPQGTGRIQLSREIISRASADDIERMLRAGAVVSGFAAITALINRIRFQSVSCNLHAWNDLIPLLVSAGALIPEINPDSQYPVPISTLKVLERYRDRSPGLN